MLHDNLNRLLGLHGLSQGFAGHLLDVSPTTMSLWLRGKVTPSLESTRAIAQLFEISVERLTSADFSDLLAHELADPNRYQRVEARIAKALEEKQ